MLFVLKILFALGLFSIEVKDPFFVLFRLKFVLNYAFKFVLIALILTLVDSDLVIEPKITGKASYLKILKNPPKNMTLKLGNERISKEVLITALQFAGIIK